MRKKKGSSNFTTFLSTFHQSWLTYLLFLTVILKSLKEHQFASKMGSHAVIFVHVCSGNRHKFYVSSRPMWGFTSFSFKGGRGRDMSILCEWTKKERKKNQSKIFTKCVPRDRFSWNQNKPLYTNIYRPTQNLIVFLWVRSAIYFPRNATPAIWAKVEIKYKRT